MSYQLVIVESPAKAKTIEKFLGKKYKVIASVGHVRDLPKSSMGVDIENDFEPKYINIRGKGDTIKELRAAAKKADQVLLATDPDREGEAIAWHLSTILGVDVESPCRVVFHEITKEAIKLAVKSPRPIDLSLVDAQQARRILDRLVGYSISPILWRKVKKGLSAGRVQSVATKLICDREREIMSFIPEEYWKISLEGQIGNVDDLILLDFYGDESGKMHLPSKDVVDKILAGIENEKGQIVDLENKKKHRNPPLPFITSSLQQEASNRFGFSTKKTMMLAQQLYEGISIKGKGTVGLITYMRTDSTRLSEQAKAHAKEYILSNFGNEWLGQTEDKKEKKSKNAQDAHEAIRPTYTELTPYEIEAALTPDLFKLYELIWTRFIGSQMSSALYESYAITVRINQYVFKSTGSKLLFEGFLKVYNTSKMVDKSMPDVQLGDGVSVQTVSPTQHFTQPPPRFTEASFVKELEDLGIGRPSTYVPTIGTILGRGYVEREKKQLKPTSLGFIIDEIMGDYFESIVNIDFTANMEAQFDEIELGHLFWKEAIKTFYEPFKDVLLNADQAIEKVDLTEETDIPCEKCGKMMLIRHGRYGKFLACSDYPECENTKPILKKLGIKCPDCETGEIVERKTKKLKAFFGCSDFPNCKFVSWDEPLNEKCPKCGSILTVKRTKKKEYIKCHNATCDYKEEK